MNPYRGEVAIVIDGRSRTMRLTLGALAALAARLQAGSLMGLAERFEVSVEWTNPYDPSRRGVGVPRPLTSYSGLFTFEDPRNVELVVKVLLFDEGTERILVLTGGLSDFAYTLRVRDRVTGAEKVYENRAGRYCGLIDPDAFPSP